uniref:Uncharacterized protein n=1 Tax=Rhizophora mucronata TaxID=61149 RepID=A0A2P2IR70_RHIMU
MIELLSDIETKTCQNHN